MSNLPVNRCNSASNSQQGDPRSTATLVLPEARSAFNIATDAVCRVYDVLATQMTKPEPSQRIEFLQGSMGA
jgi:hypothetical protein